jgi:uncharacterized SAM-dependent methyltransferase
MFTADSGQGTAAGFLFPSWRISAADIARYNAAMNRGTAPETPPIPFSTLVLLREEEIAAQFAKAFADRYLPEHLFYWLPTSVRAWVNLCRSTEYKNANRAIEVLSSAAPELANLCSGCGTLCGLGCGEGSKDRILLEAFAQAGRRIQYLAADFSQALLELAADGVDEVARDVLGCKLDLSRRDHLIAVTGAAQSFGGAVLYSVLGNTLGAFGPREFPARIREQMREQDYFLFDGEIFSDQTIAGYDNPVNRRFAWGPLNGIGITEDDGQLIFSTAPLEDGLYSVNKNFIARRDLRARIGDQTLEIQAGEGLGMSGSIKYVSESALLQTVEAAGFLVDSRWRSRDGMFILALARAV